jgi:hypothetical protein
VGPVKIDFFNKVFLLFDALLTAVFKDMVFNPTKIIKGTYLGPILLKKYFLERHLIGPVKFLLLLLPVCNYHNRNGKIFSSQRKKQNKASLSGSKVMIFFKYLKSTFWPTKIAHCYAPC